MKKFWKRNQGTIIVVGIVVLLLLFTLLTGEKKQKDEEQIDWESVSEEVQTWYLATQEDQSVVTVIASSTCPHCSTYKPVIQEVADEEQFKLFIFDVDTLSSEDSNALHNAYVLENNEGYVPYTFITNAGSFVVDYTGGMDKDTAIGFLKDNHVIE